ncbi:MAG: T9SS type A sorting domain-containing protein [Bacteroidetes bacterium]|nr:T9SS type A sorting domain-containing protein [Bacteroidota bacterium]
MKTRFLILSIAFAGIANAQGIWSQKTNLTGSARRLAVGFSIGNKGYIGTGRNGATYYNDLWEWDKSTNAWTQKANMPGVARSNAVGFSIGTKGYIGTGYDGTNYLADFYEWNQANNTWSAKASFGGGIRVSAVGFSIGTKGYIGTGYSSTYTQDFWEWNQTTDTWIQKANFLGIGRYFATGFSIGNKGYIGTGYDGTNSFQDFYEWNQLTDMWTQKADFDGGPTLGAVGFSIGSRGYIGTGAPDININTSTDYFSEYDPSSDTLNGTPWQYKASFGGGTREYAVGFSIGSYGYIGTGRDASNTMWADLWEWCSLQVNSFTKVNVLCYGGNNGSAKVNMFGGTLPYTYNWNNGQTMQTATGLIAGNYTVTITDNGGCNSTGTVSITQPNQLTVTALTINNPVCNHTGIINANVFGGTQPYTYSWSNGQTTSSISGLMAGNYTVTINDNNNCISTSTVSLTNNYLPTPNICMVTVDSLSLNNIIVWDKTSYAGTSIDSFIIYREITTNNYLQIGAVKYDSLSLFIDTVKTKYFPNTGDPNAGTYRYKIAAKDTCGNYSALSPYHNTIFITNNSGNFSWAQLYTIEGSSNPVSAYDLLRDDNSTGNFQPVASVAGTQQNVTDPAYATYQTTASWRVKTQWSIICTPTIKNVIPFSSSLNSSKSNVYKNGMVGINENSDGSDFNIFISPNPSNGIFTIQSPNKISNIEISNLIGEKIYSSKVNSSQTEIDLTKQPQGIYFIKVNSEKGTSIKKLIKE